jgi:hypothetical protein
VADTPQPAGCYTCLSDRQLLALIAEGISSGIPPVGLTDVNIVSSVPLVVSGDLGRTWTLDFATDQVDASGSVIALDAATLAALETITVLQGTNPWTVDGTVTVNQGTSPWVVSVSNFPATVAVTQSGVWSVGRTWDLDFATDQVDVSGSVVALDAATLTALETITVLQGTSPWVVSGTFTPSGTQDVNIVSSITLTVAATDFDIRNLSFATDKVDTSGSIVALDVATLAALETITVLQGTSPWTVSGTVTTIPSGTQDVNIVSSITLTVQATDLDIRNLAFATDKVDASGSVVALDAATLTALETITVLQGTSPWVVSATDLDIRNLVFATDKVDASGSSVSVSNFPATQPVIGTVTANQGTSPWVVSLTSTTITGTVSVTQSTSPWVVSATDLDIRNLVFATDKVDVGGSVVALDSATLTALETTTVTQGTSPWVVSLTSTTITGTVAVTQSTSPWVVSATDLDIRNLVFATDKVDVSGSTVAPVVGTTGGATPFRNAAVTNTAVAVKAAAGKVWSYNIFNPGVALAYLHFYDLASGSVVVGTTVPTRSVALQSNATSQVGVDTSFGVGIQFSTAISIAATTTPGGGTAPATALVVNIDYA